MAKVANIEIHGFGLSGFVAWSYAESLTDEEKKVKSNFDEFYRNVKEAFKKSEAVIITVVPDLCRDNNREIKPFIRLYSQTGGDYYQIAQKIKAVFDGRIELIVVDDVI